VYFYDALVHTPLVPFGIGFLGATAGVMITASHNPAEDNGYKVYWSNGCQIIPPHDINISRKIAENLELRCWAPRLADGCVDVVRPLEKVKEAYFKALAGLTAMGDISGMGSGGFKFVYTPMHGVGLEFMEQAVSNLEGHMVVVSEQVSTDL
jgi:phosphoglucomutase